MQLDTDEFGALADMLSAQKTAMLEKELTASREDAAYWRKRCEMAEQMQAVSQLENLFLTNYILLSTEKIKAFVAELGSVDRWTLLRTFVEWSLPEELQAKELPLIDAAMPMPSQPVPGGVVLNEPKFNGPMFDIHDNLHVTVVNDKTQRQALPKGITHPQSLPKGGEAQLPEVFDTEEGRGLLDAAREAGWLEEHYQPLISRTQSALLANAMDDRLGIREKWKVFEGLWNRRNMYRDYYKALSLQQSLAFQDEMKSVFR